MTLDPAIERAAGIGDNSSMVPEDFRISVTPPEDIAPYLKRSYSKVVDRYEELVRSANEAPPTITNDIDSGKVGDLIKEIRRWDAEADSGRKIEKEPFQKGGATVDAFFKAMMESMDKLKKRITGAQDEYLNKKKEEARRALEAEALRKRQEAERLAREAAQAEERKIAAEEAQRTADQAAAEARENQDEIEQIRLDAENVLAQAKLRKAAARRDRDEAGFAKASDEVLTAQAALLAAKERVRQARQEQRRLAEAAQAAADKAAREALATENKLDDAVRADARAGKLERKAETVTDAELARGRGEHGSVNTLAKRWVYDVTDRPALNAALTEYLADFLDIDEIKIAIGRRMATGRRDVPGVKYEQVSESRAL